MTIQILLEFQNKSSVMPSEEIQTCGRKISFKKMKFDLAFS